MTKVLILGAYGQIVDLLGAIASRKKATSAQIAIAWLLAQKPFIVPIPGTRKLYRLQENIGAMAIELTPDELHDINAAIATIKVQGKRGTGNEQYL
jgi:aryl-alcohol dehydrogenase-like predicted oxidoreductase